MLRSELQLILLFVMTLSPRTNIHPSTVFKAIGSPGSPTWKSQWINESAKFVPINNPTLSLFMSQKGMPISIVNN